MALRKWWEVYSGSEEKKVFVGADGRSGLIRKTDFEWRSTGKLVEESGLSRARVEQILDKYFKAGIVVQHPKDAEKWGYWERVDPSLGTATTKSIAEKDQEKRLEKADPKKKINKP